MNSIDNGFLKMDHVRIPRRNMLMRYAKVDKSGNYEKVGSSDKLAYLGMVGIRAGIVMTAGFTLARAVTVAVRYSIVRHQFGTPEKVKKNAKKKYQRTLTPSTSFILY